MDLTAPQSAIGLRFLFIEHFFQDGRKVRYPVGSYKCHKTGEREMPQLARPSLLEMLLKDEIREERNRILQAVHYIVQNDFFGVN
jgi:hypothetical protein